MHEDPAGSVARAPDQATQVLLQDLLSRQPLLAAINSVLALLTAVLLLGRVSASSVLGWLALMLLARISHRRVFLGRGLA